MYSDIDLKIIQHGYKREYKAISPSNTMILVAKTLTKLKVTASSIKSLSLEEALKESEDFLKSHFNLHKISYQSITKLKDFINKRKDLSLYEMLKEYNEFGQEIDPYNIPIRLEDKDFWFGCIGQLGINHATEEFLKEAKVIFTEMLLSKRITNVTPRIISHEIIHSQLNSKKGSMQSYYNYEVLPIFIEYLHSIECDSTLQEFSLEKRLRYLDIASDIKLLEEYNQKNKSLSLKDAIIKTMYLESEMKALQLLEIFLNSSSDLKNYILDYIQKIFDNEKTVEELLEKFNITLEESSNYFKNKIYLKEKRG